MGPFGAGSFGCPRRSKGLWVRGRYIFGPLFDNMVDKWVLNPYLSAVQCGCGSDYPNDTTRMSWDWALDRGSSESRAEERLETGQKPYCSGSSMAGRMRLRSPLFEPYQSWKSRGVEGLTTPDARFRVRGLNTSHKTTIPSGGTL